MTATRCEKPGDCAVGSPGTWCSYGVAVDKLPFSFSGQGDINSYSLPKGACGNNKVLGGTGQDRAFTLVAAKTGAYTVTVKSKSGHDAVVYATQDCTQLTISCAGFADKQRADGTETLVVNAQAGQTWHVVVDNAIKVTGGFTLEIKGP